MKFQPVFRRSLKDIFHELSDLPSKRKINPKSAAVADVVALGDSWLNFAIEKGLIEPMKGLEEKDWFNDLSDKWKVRMRTTCCNHIIISPMCEERRMIQTNTTD